MNMVLWLKFYVIKERLICDQAREKVPLGAIINFYFIILFYCPGNADHYGESLNHARPKVA